MIVEVSDLKAHLNITFDDDDALLGTKIEAAEKHIEGMLGHGLDTYTGGVPADLVEAVRQYAGHIYENREASLVGVTAMQTLGFSETIATYRDWSF